MPEGTERRLLRRPDCGRVDHLYCTSPSERQELREAGFTGVEVKHLPHDFQNSYIVATKG